MLDSSLLSIRWENGRGQRFMIELAGYARFRLRSLLQSPREIPVCDFLFLWGNWIDNIVVQWSTSPLHQIHFWRENRDDYYDWRIGEIGNTFFLWIPWSFSISNVSILIWNQIKFGVIPRAEGLVSLRQLVFDFRLPAVEMLCTFVENCGFYLFRWKWMLNRLL